MAEGNTVFKESTSNQFVFRMKIAHKIKDIRKKFNTFLVRRVAYLRSYSFKLVRGAMIQLLLNLICQEIIFFALIVGIGGLGKIVMSNPFFHDKGVVKSNF
ncbi:hypothetical protein DVH24_010692 [Malus domestica]|uniref:Uncharacterized protein n=1 Tax=Malus domestica TaxID=3750 RepID=A0A498JTV0_MALDO|nr:hypothetical protein DVH24_010692 [Malus domestica]